MVTVVVRGDGCRCPHHSFEGDRSYSDCPRWPAQRHVPNMLQHGIFTNVTAPRDLGSKFDVYLMCGKIQTPNSGTRTLLGVWGKSPA